MAIGMKEWVGLTAAGLVVVAAWTLPPSYGDREFSPEALGSRRAPEIARYQEVRRQYYTNLGVLMATRWADSLSELTVRTAVDGIAAGVPMENVTPARYDEWVAELREMSRSLRPRDPEMLLGVYHLNALDGAPEGVTSAPPTRGGIYVGVRDGTPYCMLVEAWADSPDDRIFRGFPPLAACRFYARYGRPGARLAEWLDAGGIRFGVGSRTSVAPEPPSRPWWLRLDAPVFGLARLPIAGRHPTGGRCLAGDRAACERLLTEWTSPVEAWETRMVRDVLENAPITYARTYLLDDSFTASDYYLLEELEGQFGPEAFARFWQSDAELPEAFRAAFGTDLGSWAMEYMQSEVGRHWAGPALEAGTPLWVLLTVMTLAAFVTWRARRRQVG